VWSAVLGYAVWDDVPSTLKIIGAVMVVGAGLLILYRETQRKTEKK
jgi:drug/metabolite transporter (DMT)-like permease